jgi:primosomal protein N' (replication factor Y)
LASVVRVVPDVTAVDRAFDYTFDDGVPAGTTVRVTLHGRRVRGWIVAAGVEPEAHELLPVLAVVSAGPPPDVVDLTEWIAHRWAGPRVAVLRSASPPNIVPPGVCADVARVRATTARTVVRVVRSPPLDDRRSLVADMCAAAGSTIVCVADAGRGRALASFLTRHGRRAVVLHSFLTDAERTAAWRRAAAGECVVVGGRVAALAPVPDLQAAIVVDDADEALQEERAPTWHAREVLHERAARAGVPFTVCSPAPTVEAMHVASGVVAAPARDVERRGWPRVRVVDLGDEPPGTGVLTEPLADALRNARGLAVCVLNRRGRFRLLACAQCRHVLRWDAAAERPLVCPECGAARPRLLRAGVKRLREELEALLPGTRVADVDAAAGSVPDAAIVIGTEAVLHRAEVRRRRPVLVAYLDLDQELLAPRYRAAAQAHWLITRGAQLLAGRPRAETQLLLQTRMPDHVVVQAVADGDPARVAAAEAETRRSLGYPPFGALAELRGEEVALAEAIAVLGATGAQVFGPDDGRALVHAATWDDLSDALASALRAGRLVGRVRAAVDPPRV